MKVSYIDDVSERLSFYYDIKSDQIINNTFFDLYAVSNVQNSKYMGSKKVVVYAYNNNSYIYIKKEKVITIDSIVEVLDKNVEILLNQSRDDDNHMSTHYTFVFVSDTTIDNETIKFVKKYRKQKSYSFGLNGWSSIGIILISLNNNTVINNKDAKRIAKAFKS
ncbi:MAG: hypothetical protein ACK5NF_06595 [Bacilli bacterium]